MACTTILVGKDASYDGSTIIARNEDSANGEFCPKRFIVVKPEEQPRRYRSVLSHVEIDLPDYPMRYTAVPNADTPCAVIVAHAAPAIPISSPKMKSGSKIVLMTAPAALQTIE